MPVRANGCVCMCVRARVRVCACVEYLYHMGMRGVAVHHPRVVQKAWEMVSLLLYVVAAGARVNAAHSSLYILESHHHVGGRAIRLLLKV